jgi:hypothetical protein
MAVAPALDDITERLERSVFTLQALPEQSRFVDGLSRFGWLGPSNRQKRSIEL